VPSITSKNGQKDLFDKPLHLCKPMMFSELPTDTARFPKEELKEEIEEEKEIQQDRSRSEFFRDIDQTYVEERSSHHSNVSHHSNNIHQNSESDEEIIEQEEPDREIDMVIDERITPRTLVDNRVIREHSFHTRAEMNSSVENLSHTMPHIQIPNEYQQNHNTVNDRRLFNHLIGTGSEESSDYEDAENSRNYSNNAVEEQIGILYLHLQIYIIRILMRITCWY
jgi:hypothetical protein